MKLYSENSANVLFSLWHNYISDKTKLMQQRWASVLLQDNFFNFFFFFPSIAFSQDSCRYKWVQDQAQMISWCVYVVLNISLKALLFKHIHLKCFLFLILACFTWLKWWRISKNNINHLNCLFCWKELKEFRWVSKWYLNSFSFYSTRMQYGMLYTVSVGFHKCSCPK